MHSRKEFRDKSAVPYQIKVQVRTDPVHWEQDEKEKHGRYANNTAAWWKKSMVVNSM